MRSIINIIKKEIKLTNIVTFIISLIIILISLIYCGFAPFGPRDVLTANEQTTYTRYFFELYDMVHSGKNIFSYSMYEGTGYDFTTVLTYFLSDPTNLIILIFPRTMLFSVLSILYALKVALGGFFMSIYLTNTNLAIFKSNKKKKAKKEKKESEKNKSKDLVIGGKETAPGFLKILLEKVDFPIIAFSLIYSFSNYMLGPGFNIAHQGAVCIFPLLVLGLDKLIHKNEKKLYIITYIISFFLSFQMTIISSIFMILYTFIKPYKDHKKLLSAIKNKLLSDIIVLLCSSVIILNNIYSTFWRSSLTGIEELGKTNSIFDVIKMMTTSIKPASMLLAGSNIYMYCGIVTLLFALCFIFNSSIKLQVRIKYIILYIVLFSGFIFVSVNTVLNGFVFFDGIESSFAYTFIFLSIIISFIFYKNINKDNTISVFIPSVITALLVIGALFLCHSYDTPSIFIKSLEFIFLYAIILLIYSNNSLTKWLLKICLSILIIIELLITFIPGMKLLSWFTYPYDKIVIAKNNFTLEYLDKTYHDKNKLIIESNKSYHTPLEIELLGYDLIVCSEDHAYKTLEKVDEYKDKSIYSIVNSHNSYFLNSSAIEYKYDRYSPIDSINNLSEYVLQTPITMIPTEYSEAGGNYANYNNYIDIYHETGGDLFFNYSYISNVNDTNEDEVTEFEQLVNKNRNKYVKGLYTFSLDDYISTQESLIGYDINISNPNNTSFSINTPDSGYLTLGLYNRPGWKITVNNEKVKTTEYLQDGMIVPVNKGDNNIYVSYKPIVFYIGLIISLISILALSISKKLIPYAKMKNKISNKIKYFVKNNYTYIISIIIITLLFIICQIIAGRYPFGSLPSFTSDGLEQLYSKHINNINEIKNNKIFLFNNFSIGGFKETYEYKIKNIIFPWFILKYKLIPNSLILLDFTFKLFFNVAFSSFSIIYYLTHKSNYSYDKKDIRLIPISLLYALCSYGMVMFAYESFRYTCYLPLIILGLDYILNKKKQMLYIIMLSLMMIHETYHAFLLCEFLVLYFLTLHFDNIKDFTKKLIRFGVCSILSAGLAAFYLVPYYIITTQSVYLDNDKVLPSITTFFSNFLTMISDYRSFNVFGAISNNNSQAAIYAGMILVFVIPLYIFTKSIPKSQRIRTVVLLAILYFAFNNELFNYVLHGFHVQSMVPNRFAIFFVFLMIDLLSIEILSFKDYSQSVLQGTIIITSILFIFMYLINRDISKISLIVSVALLVSFIALIIIYTIRKISNTVLLKFMICIAVLDIVANYIYIFPKQIAGSSNIIEEANSINRISDQVPDTKEFYNLTEYIGNHPLYHNIGFMTDINTLTYFASDYTRDMYDRVKYYNLSASNNVLDYSNGNPLADMMLGVKYHIEDMNDDSAYSIYNNILNYGHYNLYENPNYVSFGFLVQNDNTINSITLPNNDNNNAFEYQNKISEAIINKDIYTSIQCNLYTNDKEYNSSETYYTYGDIYTTQNAKTDNEAYVPVRFLIGDNINGNVYICMNNTIFFLGPVNEDNRELSIDYPLDLVNKPDFTPYIAVLNEDTLASLHNELANNKMENIKLDNNTITGNINCNNSGALYLSLPYYDSWKIYIDGKEMNKERFMGGIGVPITSGEHTIKMIYYPRGVALGTLISIITILILLVYGFYLKKGHSYIKITKDINKGGSKE